MWAIVYMLVVTGNVGYSIYGLVIILRILGSLVSDC